MKILILSAWGGGTALGWRLVKEGHKVQMWIKNKDYANVGDGFIPKIDSWQESSKTVDLIIADDGGFGKTTEELKKQGKMVWGGTEWSDKIESDRGMGQEALRSVGMTVIPYQDFPSAQDAAKWLKSNSGRYVVKLDGPIQDEKALSYVAKEENGSDLTVVLEQYQSKWASKITSVHLQEFKKGIEVAISGFFNGKDFVEPIAVGFEHKKLMNGNIGPSTGEMGTTQIWIGKRKIYRDTIGKAVKLLAEHNYTGYVDINCIATDKDIYPLEWTTRFGYPTIHMGMETIKGNMGDLMYRVASGDKANFKISNPYSIVVVVATPPYPFMSEDIYKKYGEDQMIIFRSKERTGIWPGEVLRDEKNNWFITGESGFTVMCTGQGKDLQAARSMVYKRVENLTIPNCLFRTDIGEKTDQDLKTLNNQGWFET